MPTTPTLGELINRYATMRHDPIALLNEGHRLAERTDDIELRAFLAVVLAHLAELQDRITSLAAFLEAQPTGLFQKEH